MISYIQRRRTMQDWNEIVQFMLDWLEDHLDENPLLENLSREVGYSPWYCSVLFHNVTGMTLKSYVAGRRLSRAAADIRDTGERILDLSIKYGYSSQESLSRAFKGRYGMTPAAFRKNPMIVPMFIKKRVLFPSNSVERRDEMKEDKLNVHIEHIPAHKYIGIWEKRASNYGEFWKYHGCDEVCGYVDSIGSMSHPIVTAHTAGWKKSGDKLIYFYGSGLPLDYSGPVPEDFELREIPDSEYLVFSYPPFDYMEENGPVMEAVEKLAWGFDPGELGYEWNDEVCPIYQRHYPEKLGYQVVRPVKKKVR